MVAWLTAAGCDARHTLDLPDGNRTTDVQLNDVVDRTGRRPHTGAVNPRARNTRVGSVLPTGQLRESRLIGAKWLRGLGILSG